MGGVAVVTGASAGVGRAIAREFARDGWDVAVLARGAAGVAAVESEVRLAGRRALAHQVDVADYQALDAVATDVESKLGPINVWVNNAFTSVFAPFTQVSMEEFKRTTEVTYLGYVHGTRVALDRMLSRGRGSIVQVGSALAYRGIPLQSAYCGAKHAIQGFNESLRCELLHDRSKIRTTMVQLPAVNTPQFDWVLSRLPRHPQPVPPIYQPEVLARAIVRIAKRPRRREYYLGASTAATILGDKVASGLLDRLLARTGYNSQQTRKRRAPDRPANLWHPADDTHDFGAHGSFDDHAAATSVQAETTTLLPWPLAAAADTVAAAFAGARIVGSSAKAWEPWLSRSRWHG